MAIVNPKLLETGVAFRDAHDRRMQQHEEVWRAHEAKAPKPAPMLPPPGCTMKDTDGVSICDGRVYRGTRTKCGVCGVLNEANARAVCESLEAFAYDVDLFTIPAYRDHRPDGTTMSGIKVDLSRVERGASCWTPPREDTPPDTQIAHWAPTPLLAFQAMRDALLVEMAEKIAASMRVVSSVLAPPDPDDQVDALTYAFSNYAEGVKFVPWSIKALDRLAMQPAAVYPIPLTYQTRGSSRDAAMLHDMASRERFGLPVKPAIKAGDVVRFGARIEEVTHTSWSTSRATLVHFAPSGSVAYNDCTRVDPYDEPLRVGDEVESMTWGACVVLADPEDVSVVLQRLSTGARHRSYRGALRLVRRRGEG